MRCIEDKYFIAIAEYIKVTIEDKDIDISDLAAAANVDRKQIYRLINKENIPKLSTLVRISLAAGIKPHILFALEFDFEIYMKENNIFKATPKKMREKNH